LINSHKIKKDTSVVILAGGRGKRLGGEVPKQYQLLNGISMISYSIKVFIDHPRIDTIQVVIHSEDYNLYKEATIGFDLAEPVSGGNERQNSSRIGVSKVYKNNTSYVLIHDAARPFITRKIVDQIFQELDLGNDCVIPGIRVKDTLKRSSDQKVIETIDRSGLWYIQTPQGFNLKKFYNLQNIDEGIQYNDDASMAEKHGMEVVLVESSEMNFKITTQEDMRIANKLLVGEQRIPRIGSGFDVHRFSKGSGIILCGIYIPFHSSLLGHSDADVGIHAITDSILGAIGSGDIGELFPPNDPKWENSNSEIFLKDALKRVDTLGGIISNIDLTIICEEPKINPFRDEMRRNLARILKVELNQVNIKATTTEKLGFTGRREGIAAQAVSCILL
jgi:2-C-methyl-D-erythritol 4-phosphate cytidylyltransferase/2-C-methyl-D-erythritol 2,4-cyclodiphosphate synthase